MSDYWTYDSEVIPPDKAWDTVPDPGKFEGEPYATVAAYNVVMDGFSDGIGDEGFGYYDVVELDPENGYPALRCILTYTDAGFVSGTHYDTDEALREAVTKLETDYNQYLTEQGEDEQC